MEISTTKKTVLIEVRKGVCEIYTNSSDIEVVLLDYDIDGVSLYSDEEGVIFEDDFVVSPEVVCSETLQDKIYNYESVIKIEARPIKKDFLN